MKIEFDPTKDATNIAKHNISLARAVEFEMLAVQPDTRFDYGEERFMGNASRYHLDLKVKADVGAVSAAEVRTALLAHAAHQLNRLKARHTDALPMAAE